MRLDGVGKRYGLRQRWVVRGVSADVAAGQPGLDAESRTQLAGLPGVGGVHDVPGIDGGGRIAVRFEVTAAASDAVVRQVLSWDDVHVVAVRPESGAEPGTAP